MKTRRNANVVVLNASMEPLAIVPLKRAMTFLLHERAVIVEAVPGRTVKSATAEFPYPLVVQFREMVRVPFSYAPMPWSRRGVLARDNHECAFCSKRATTVDHVVPRSRGGRDEWLNTVAACSRCNNIKADRTPEEAGMPLRFKPREVTRRDSIIVGIAALGADLGSLGLATA